MNVLSLFDGMSCGQIALNKLGIKYNKYFACEIDKYAMQVTQHNYPGTVQLGDVQFVTKETFGTHKIDLLIGGSPCQGFSFAGKQLNFEDPRSALFFEFVRLLKELNPKHFLLENVVMKQEYQDVISKYMGCEPVKINSALVSAQTRKRLYWTNIPGIAQPEDKGIILKDIIEKGDSCDMVVKIGKELHKEDIDKPFTGVRVEQVDDKPIKVGNIYPSGGQNGNVYSEDGKSPSILAGTGNKGTGVGSCNAPKIEQVGDKLRHPEATKKGYAEASVGEGLDLTFPTSKTRRGRTMKDKSNCLTAASHEMGVVIDPSKPNQINPDKSAKSSSEDEKGTQPHMQDRVFHEDGKSHALTSSFASRTKIGNFDVRCAAIRARSIDKDGNRVAWKETKPKQMLEVRKDSKSNSVTSVQKDNVLTKNQIYWRKLTPLECERLQTVPDGYTLVMEDDKQKVSNSQRYKMLGNGWTVDVIAHIFKGINND
tara:strand:+ start:4872 stop:6317 length:1446 start_codon:yes stop_codon:yes gene_type:complete